MAGGLYGALSGAAAGGIVSLAIAVGHSRMRRFSLSIDNELSRLDDLIDATVGLAKVRAAAMDVGASDIAGLSEKRHRLGRSLTRLLSSKDGFEQLTTSLAVFSSHLARLEPGEGVAVVPDLDRIEDDGRAVRRAVTVLARRDFYWRWFGGSHAG